MEMLIAARVVQGAFAALLLPQVMSTIQAALKEPAKTRLLSYYTAIGGLSAAVGQLLGGVIEVFSPDAFVEGEDDQGCGGDRGDGSGIEGDVREGLEVLDQGVGPLGGSPH